MWREAIPLPSDAAKERPRSFRRHPLLVSTRSPISQSVYETFAQGQKKTWKDDIAKVRKYLMPVWGSRPLRSITRAHVHELLDTLVARG